MTQFPLQTTERLSELNIACCSPCWLSTSWLLARFTVSQLSLQPRRERAKSPDFVLASVAVPVEVRLHTPCRGRCSKGDLGMMGRPVFSVQGLRRRVVATQANKRARFSEFGDQPGGLSRCGVCSAVFGHWPIVSLAVEHSKFVCADKLKPGSAGREIFVASSCLYSTQKSHVS